MDDYWSPCLLEGLHEAQRRNANALEGASWPLWCAE
jgi:hypothetical protein